MSVMSVSDAAREIGCKPRAISDLLYDRALDDTLFPIVSGRRVIPRDALPLIRLALKKRGRLPNEDAVHA